MKLKIKQPTTVTTQQLTKRMFYLAWKAAGSPIGMGFFQDRGEQPEDSVWERIVGETDYGTKGKEHRPYGDYVFGRMMKMGVDITDDFIDVRDGKQRPDYQGWSIKYPTYQELANAAAKELGITLEAI